ncbi:MAG TPA: alpha/beta hydrolase, partial [Marmoricola sp.]|nr:alpha/beta hydrolase [Marmoricola sp.]
PVDPQLENLLSLIAAAPSMADETPEEARSGFRTLTINFRKPEDIPEVGSVEDGEVAGAEGSLRARIYRPATTGPHPTVAFFHGGGYVIGDLDTHDALARAICRDADTVVVSVDYRLAPEAPFPAGPHDAIAATRDIQSRLKEFGGTEILAVAGDSAGGNFSAVTAQNVPGVAAQFLIYPATDVIGDYASREENGEGYFLDTPTLAWFITHYASGARDWADPLMSPLRGKLTDLPPAVVVTAEFDPLRDEGIAYAKALEEAGVRVDAVTYPGMIHGFIDMGPWSPGAQAATDDAIRRFAALLRSL